MEPTFLYLHLFKPIFTSSIFYIFFYSNLFFIILIYSNLIFKSSFICNLVQLIPLPLYLSPALSHWN
jgi:hypothetical protein